MLPVLYVALAALLIYGVMRVVRARRAGANRVAEELGPWPVAPGRVESRHQLIRAFDYLAQLRCGPGAKAWHHRAVAARLPRDPGENRAAGDLAALYEWARYAPEAGELPPEAAADARRHLAQLSGGAA